MIRYQWPSSDVKTMNTLMSHNVTEAESGRAFKDYQFECCYPQITSYLCHCLQKTSSVISTLSVIISVYHSYLYA